MEWRQRTSVSCEDAFTEAQRWMEDVTNKTFGCNNFRSALENGVLLCHLINRLKPGIIKRMNTLSTPMAGLDNVNVFLRACGTLGLHEAQLFHPGDLQDLSTRATLRRVEGKRRLKNVLITIYWLGRKAQVDPFYSGPQLNLKAFEGLLGIALSKALEEAPRGGVRDSGSSEVCYPERGDQLLPLTQAQPPGYSREDSVESFKSVLSFDSVESRTLSFMSDSVLRAGSEDSSSDAEAENCFRMESAEGRDSGQGNGGNVPAPLQRKKREEYPIKGYPPSLLTSVAPPPLSPPLPQLPDVEAFLQWAYHYHSDSDSDADRPDPDVFADDLASRRFHSPSPATPTNFAVPMSPQGTLRLWTGSPRLFRIDTLPRHTAVSSPSSGSTAVSQFLPNPFYDPPSSVTPTLLSEVERSIDEELLRALCEEDSEDGREDADPIRDDLYARRVELALHQTSSNPGYNRFLPRYWTPEEEVHVRTIRLGSQRRPWYHKMQGFSRKTTDSSEDDSGCDITPWLVVPVLSARNRNLEVNPGWIWSKSLNDIRRFPSATVVLHQVSEGGVELSPSAVSQDQLQRVRARVQESEVKWHNDLTKWKLRRCRSNFDLRRKMQERDDNNVLMANAGVVTVGTFRSLQEDREEDEESLYSSSHATVSPSTLARDGSLDLRPHTRAPLALGSSEESPYSPGASEPSTTPSVTLQAQGPSARAAPRSEPLVLGERRRTGTPVDQGAAGGLAPTLASASPLSFQTHARAISSPALMISTGLDQNTSMLSNGTPTTLTNGIGSCFTTGTSSSPTASGLVNGTGSNLTDGTSSNRRSASMEIPDKALLSALETQTSVVEPDSGRVSAPQQQDLPLYRYSSRAPGGTEVSASLPRGYRRSEGSSTLSAGFTPRPFGSKPSRVSSIPRLYNYLQLENSTLNGDRNASLLPTKTAPSRPQKMVTISEVAVGAHPRAPANRSSVNQEVKEEGASQTQPSILNTRVGPGPATRPKPSREGPLPPPLLPSLAVSVTQNGSAQVRHSDRVSLTLKTNGRPDFGFNTHWDSAGVRVGGIQPGSPAELCQLRVGDEIVSVGGHRVAEMSHDQWKGTMTSALQKGSLTMDVQRYGNNDWGSGLTSHKIIDLTSGAPTLLGQPDASRDVVISTATRVKPAQLNGQECVTSKSMKGGVCDDPMTIRRKEHELIVLKTQERRAEFFKQKGGSASAISDLQVPSLSTSPSSWSWDPEEEMSRQEKWQQKQERLLQEKYRQDQERLDAEWQRAQEEAGVAGYSQAEVTPEPSPSRDVVGNVVPRVKSPASNAESSGEMTNGIAGLASPQPVLSQPTPHVAHVASNQKKEVVFNGVGREEPDKEAEQEEETDGLAEGDDWSGDTYGFTQLSTADRMKSKSSSSLDGFHRQEMKGGNREVPRRKLRQSMSLVEAERQQILEEMKRRTALLTDNSWIRPRSTSVNKQPVNRRGPMRRYESLDNLPSTTSSPSLLSNPQRPHSPSLPSNPQRPHSPSHPQRPHSPSHPQRPHSPSHPQRPHSSLGFTAPYRPPSSRHSMGGALSGYSNGTQKHSPTWPRPFSTSSTPPNPGEEPATGESRPGSQQRDRVGTSRQVCSVCDCPLGRGAVMVIETLSLRFHLACFQCVDCRCHLGGSEVRTQIRIRNRKPYCEPCYIRLKSRLASSL